MIDQCLGWTRLYLVQLSHWFCLQRYAKLPVIGDSFAANTCVAFDLMSINLADLPALPRLLPALKVGLLLENWLMSG